MACADRDKKKKKNAIAKHGVQEKAKQTNATHPSPTFLLP
jgi:hypothetical protein